MMSKTKPPTFYGFASYGLRHIISSMVVSRLSLDDLHGSKVKLQGRQYQSRRAVPEPCKALSCTRLFQGLSLISRNNLAIQANSLMHVLFFLRQLLYLYFHITSPQSQSHTVFLYGFPPKVKLKLLSINLFSNIIINITITNNTNFHINHYLFIIVTSG